MEEIGNGIYRRNGLIFVAMKNSSNSLTDCIQCHFGLEPCPITTCRSLLGSRKYLKLYEEPKKVEKIKLSELSFKCAVLTPERSEILQKAVFAAGGAWKDSSVGQNVFVTKYAFLMITNGVMSHQQNDFRFFANSPLPETTLQQALVILSAVEKPEPVFDIKIGNQVLCRDAESPGNSWEVKQFARMSKTGGWPFVTFESKFTSIVKYEGNESLLGTTDTPSGWWEAKDGKPVWVTK